MEVKYLNNNNITQISDVLYETFYDYPAMKYILGENKNYDQHLRKLITFFVYARALRNEPMIGIADEDNNLVAVSLVTLPGDIHNPDELLERFINLWQEIGEEEQARYTTYGISALSFFPKEPHHHLNMIGVRKAYQRKGLGRQLMNEIEELVSQHPTSTGLSLNTEKRSNVDFYIHLDYKLIGEEKIDNDIVTWGFFKSLISWSYLILEMHII